MNKDEIKAAVDNIDVNLGEKPPTMSEILHERMLEISLHLDIETFAELLCKEEGWLKEEPEENPIPYPARDKEEKEAHLERLLQNAIQQADKMEKERDEFKAAMNQVMGELEHAEYKLEKLKAKKIRKLMKELKEELSILERRVEKP